MEKCLACDPADDFQSNLPKLATHLEEEHKISIKQYSTLKITFQWINVCRKVVFRVQIIDIDDGKIEMQSKKNNSNSNQESKSAFSLKPILRDTV